MKVSELIEMLQKANKEAEFRLSVDITNQPNDGLRVFCDEIFCLLDKNDDTLCTLCVGGKSNTPLVGVWQPIETAPKDVDIDVIVDGKRFINSYYSEHRKSFMIDRYCEISGREDSYKCKPTHWMPIPPLPNEVKK